MLPHTCNIRTEANGTNSASQNMSFEHIPASPDSMSTAILIDAYLLVGYVVCSAPALG